MHRSSNEKTWDVELAELKSRFVAGLETRLRFLEEEHTIENWSQVAVLAHKLKGAAQGYGFKDLADIAGLVEDSALENDGEAVTRLMEALVASMTVARSISGPFPKSQ